MLTEIVEQVKNRSETNKKVIEIIHKTQCWRNVPKEQIENSKEKIRKVKEAYNKPQLNKMGDAEIATMIVALRLTNPKCAKCLKPELDYKFKRCGKCKIVLYCSRECQNEHWKSGHKKECFDHKEKEFWFGDRNAKYTQVWVIENEKQLDTLSPICYNNITDYVIITCKEISKIVSQIRLKRNKIILLKPLFNSKILKEHFIQKIGENWIDKLKHGHKIAEYEDTNSKTPPDGFFRFVAFGYNCLRILVYDEKHSEKITKAWNEAVKTNSERNPPLYRLKDLCVCTKIK